jgi:hypothetical protein
MFTVMAIKKGQQQATNRDIAFKNTCNIKDLTVHGTFCNHKEIQY